MFVGCGCWLLKSVTLEAVRACVCALAMAMLEQAASFAASWVQIEEVKLLGCRRALLRLPQRCRVNRGCLSFSICVRLHDLACMFSASLVVWQLHVEKTS